MGTLNIKGLPTETHELLRKQAEKNHRSLNREILSILEKAVGQTTYTNPEKTLLDRVRETSEQFNGTMTLEEFDQAKREGRL